jgi:hypothetical protein
MAVSPKISQEAMSTLFKDIEDKLGPLEPDTLSTTVALVMSKIRSLTQLNNTERKDLVVYIINQLADKLEEEKKGEIKSLVSTVVPRMVDTIVDISKGKIKVNKMTGTQSFFSNMKKRIVYLLSCGCVTCSCPSCPYTCERVDRDK